MRWYDPCITVLTCVSILACGDGKKTKIEVQKETVQVPVDCSNDFASRCAEVSQQIEAAQIQLSKATADEDLIERYAAQMKLNELMEIREAYRSGNGDVEAIRQRYESLRLLVEENSAIQIETAGAVAYGTEELAATREVLKDFGDLSLDPKSIEKEGEPAKLTVHKIDDKPTPWASYWYPKRGNEIFEPANAPLRKLDAYLDTLSVKSQTVRWEKDHYDPRAAEWEGLCDAWSIASTLTVEPKTHVKINDIEFSPSDLKAIAIKYFEGYAPKVYGRRYQGSASTDGQIQDLRPEAFHRLVEQVIGQDKKLLIIDEDPGPEIWSKPLFRMSFRIKVDPQFKNAVLVQAYPWMIRQRSTVTDDITSVAKDLSAPAYEYRLFYRPNPLPDGRLAVIAGEWINGSVNFHPDMVYLPHKAENRNQGNEDIRKNNDLIRKLLVKAGMIVDRP